MIVWVKLSQFHSITQAARGRKECPVVLGPAHFALNTAARESKEQAQTHMGRGITDSWTWPISSEWWRDETPRLRKRRGRGSRSRDTGETKDRLPQFLTWLEKVSTVAWMRAGVCVHRLPPYVGTADIISQLDWDHSTDLDMALQAKTTTCVLFCETTPRCHPSIKESKAETCTFSVKKHTERDLGYLPDVSWELLVILLKDLSLNFLIYKMKTIVLTSQGCWRI